MSEADPRLDRLYDYTKFHIGIYFLIAGAMVTIAASEQLQNFLGVLKDGSVWVLIAAIVSMMLAGAAGGVIASSCAVAARFEDVWERPIGPWRWRPMSGRSWAALEHGAFWISLILLLIAAVLPLIVGLWS